MRSKVAGASEEARKQIVSATASGASAIASWGLLQAVLFWETKGRDTDEGWLCQVLQRWLTHETNPRRQLFGAESVTDALLDLPSTVTYRRLTTDALELFSFLKRFAKVAAQLSEASDAPA